jgi:hypothetical protein
LTSLKLIVTVNVVSILSGLRSRGRSNVTTLLGLLSAVSKTINLVLAVLLNEGNKILNGTRTSVLNRGILSTSGVDLDGGEASDGIGHIVGSGVDLGDGDFLVELGNVGVQSSELLVLGGKRLAVSTPRSVELNQDILLIVNDNLLEVAADNDGDRAFLGLGNRLRLDTGFNFALKDVLDEFADLLGINLLGLIVGVLSVLGNVLDSESGEVLGFEVQVTGVGTKELSIESDDVDVSTVLLSDRAEVSSELLTLLWGLGKNVSQGDTGLSIKVSLCSL